MLDNWTVDQFMKELGGDDTGAFEELADFTGRVCITDDFELEKVWNQFVMAYDELKDRYAQWYMDRK